MLTLITKIIREHLCFQDSWPWSFSAQKLSMTACWTVLRLWFLVITDCNRRGALSATAILLIHWSLHVTFDSSPTMILTKLSKTPQAFFSIIMSRPCSGLFGSDLLSYSHCIRSVMLVSSCY